MSDSAGASSNQMDDSGHLRTLLIVSRYPTIFIPLAFFSMAIFHFPLWFNRTVVFYKLMGCGRNGTFDIRPDLNQWSVMIFYRQNEIQSTSTAELIDRLCGSFIGWWWRLTKVRNNVLVMEPIAGHGTWDGKSFITGEQPTENVQGRIGVLTRATIRLSRLTAFWKAVPVTADRLEENPGFVYSVGIGEIPFIKQATFSIWETEEQMKAFAYRRTAHREVIRRTREEGWYSEEMFLRFRILFFETDTTNPDKRI